MVPTATKKGSCRPVAAKASTQTTRIRIPNCSPKQRPATAKLGCPTLPLPRLLMHALKPTSAHFEFENSNIICDVTLLQTLLIFLPLKSGNQTSRAQFTTPTTAQPESCGFARHHDDSHAAATAREWRGEVALALQF